MAVIDGHQMLAKVLCFYPLFPFLQANPNIQTYWNNKVDRDTDIEHSLIYQTKYFDTLRCNLKHKVPRTIEP